MVDQDARVGHKSRNQHFFSCKTEFTMTTKERIIIAVTVVNGAYTDGAEFDELLELTKRTELKIEEVYSNSIVRKKLKKKRMAIDIVTTILKKISVKIVP